MRLERRIVALEGGPRRNPGLRPLIVDGTGDVAVGHGRRWTREADEGADGFIARAASEVSGRLVILSMSAGHGENVDA